MNPKILPTILILIDMGAAYVYASHKGWYRVGYWICAAGITFCATFSK